MPNPAYIPYPAINPGHSLSTNLNRWWKVLPGRNQGGVWLDIVARQAATLTNMTKEGVSGWSENAPPGGFGSMRFDGTDDYIECGSGLIPTTNFTISVRAKSSATGFPNRICGNADSTGGLSGIDIILGCLTAGHIYVVARNGVNNNALDINNVSVPSIGTGFHQVLISLSSASGLSLYVDGQIISTKSATTAITSSLPFRIGRDGNGTDAFNGFIDSVKIWSRALSAIEVAQDYDLSQNGDPGLLIYPSRFLRGFFASGVTYPELERFQPRGIERGIFTGF